MWPVVAASTGLYWGDDGLGGGCDVVTDDGAASADRVYCHTDWVWATRVEVRNKRICSHLTMLTVLCGAMGLVW